MNPHSWEWQWPDMARHKTQNTVTAVAGMGVKCMSERMNYKSGNRPAGNSPGTPLVTQLRKGKVKEGWKIK